MRKFYDRVIPGIYDTFDGPQMLPLISPRPLMVINGETDDKNPLPGLKMVTDATSIAYERDGAREKFVVIIEPKTGHAVTNDAMGAAMDWFSKWIGNGGRPLDIFLAAKARRDEGRRRGLPGARLGGW